MTNKHIETLHMMQIRYSHIRKNDMEWEAIEAAKEALSDHRETEEAPIEAGWHDAGVSQRADKRGRMGIA